MKRKLNIAALGLASLLVLAGCMPSTGTEGQTPGAYSDLNSNYRTDGFADPRSK